MQYQNGALVVQRSHLAIVFHIIIYYLYYFLIFISFFYMSMVSLQNIQTIPEV